MFKYTSTSQFWISASTENHHKSYQKPCIIMQSYHICLIHFVKWTFIEVILIQEESLELKRNEGSVRVLLQISSRNVSGCNAATELGILISFRFGSSIRFVYFFHFERLLYILCMTLEVESHASTSKMSAGNDDQVQLSEASSLADVTALLIDISGTIHVENEALPGTLHAVKRLQEARIPYLFVTNTTKVSCDMTTRNCVFFFVYAPCLTLLSFDFRSHFQGCTGGWLTSDSQYLRMKSSPRCRRPSTTSWGTSCDRGSCWRMRL